MKPGWTNRVTGALLVVLGALTFMSGAGTIIVPVRRDCIVSNTLQWAIIGGLIIALGVWILRSGRPKP